MSDGAPEYVIDPNRIRAVGAEEFEAVALSLSLDEAGVTVEVRTGAFSDRTVELDYSEVVAVDRLEELAYALVFETDDTEYIVTNVSANADEVAEMVEFVRRQMRRVRRQSESTDDAGASPTAGDGGTAASGGESAAAELQRWTELYEQGVISEDELEEKKRELL